VFRIFVVFLLFHIVNSLYASEKDIALKIVQEACQYCHGLEGEASNMLYPRLAGQHKNYIVKKLHDYRSGKVKGTMNDMAANLKDDEIVALAAYFSVKPTLKHRVRDKEFAQIGWYIFHRGNKYSGVTACASCHGKNGEGSDELPRLAGQHKRYMADKLHLFQERVRNGQNSIIHAEISKLTEMEIAAVSSYLSGMK
jgi:cytochrome c553